MNLEGFGRRSISRGRVLSGFLVGTLTIGPLTGTLIHFRNDLPISTSLGLYFLAVVITSAAGGFIPGILSAIIAPLLANLFLIPPYHTLRIGDSGDLIELSIFVTTTLVVSAFVSVAARRQTESQQAWREATVLAELATSSSIDSISTILNLFCETYGFTRATLLELETDGVSVVASSGSPLSLDEQPNLRVNIAERYVLTAEGEDSNNVDDRLTRAFVEQLSLALNQRELREKATEAATLAKADELRTAILRSVSHDLRSPLANIKASVSTLLQDDVKWTPDEIHEFVLSIDADTDRLTRIVSNLLDMSRLEAGVLRPSTRRVALEEVIPGAIDGLGSSANRIVLSIPDNIHDVWADSALLERVLDNILQNAVKWSPPEKHIEVACHESPQDIHVTVVDHGPGIPDHKKALVLQPFHRLDDSAQSGGLGLGLAIADRMMSAMSGRVELFDTPGGGLTVKLSLRRTWTETP